MSCLICEEAVTCEELKKEAYCSLSISQTLIKRSKISRIYKIKQNHVRIQERLEILMMILHLFQASFRFLWLEGK